MLIVQTAQFLRSLSVLAVILKGAHIKELNVGRSVVAKVGTRVLGARVGTRDGLADGLSVVGVLVGKRVGLGVGRVGERVGRAVGTLF